MSSIVLSEALDLAEDRGPVPPRVLTIVEAVSQVPGHPESDQHRRLSHLQIIGQQLLEFAADAPLGKPKPGFPLVEGGGLALVRQRATEFAPLVGARPWPSGDRIGADR